MRKIKIYIMLNIMLFFLVLSIEADGQTRFLEENIILKISSETREPIPKKIIKGGIFVVNGKLYNSTNLIFDSDNTAELHNKENFIKLTYNQETGELKIFADSTQKSCNILTSKSAKGEVIGYLYVDGYIIDKNKSAFSADIPTIVYKIKDTDEVQPYIELGAKKNLKFKVSNERREPLKSSDINKIFYLCPDDLELGPNDEQDLYTSEYNEDSGEIILKQPLNKNCIPIKASSKNYRDSKIDVSNNNVVFLNNYYTINTFLKIKSDYQKRNDLIEEIYIKEKNGKKYLIPNHNSWITERYPENTELTINIKLKDGYETVANEYYNGYGNGLNIFRKKVIIKKYTNYLGNKFDKAEIENEFDFAIKKIIIVTFWDKYGFYIKIFSFILVISIILIPLWYFNKKGFKTKKAISKKTNIEDYFSDDYKADWED